jgi:5-formyltetrahydrofolate cyclo-ligase
MSSDLDRDGAVQGPALREAKLAMRREVLARRDGLEARARDAASRAIGERIAALSSFGDARTVLLTLAYRSEWDTLPLLRAALAAGKTLAVPRVDASARMLSLHVLRDPAADVAPGYRGIPEPREDSPRIAAQDIDWVLVPGVAFDHGGHRLGYGGGFYDRLLPLIRAGAPRVAGAYDAQLVERVPAAPHDLTIDAIVTETQTILPSPSRIALVRR